MSQDFLAPFFHDSKPSGTLINRQHTAEIISALCYTPRRQIWDRGEIKPELENNLTSLSKAQIGSNHEKNGVGKSRDTLLLMYNTTVTEVTS